MENLSSPKPSRWVFFRDISVFQVKLIIDGLRDALLIPTSIIAGLFGLITNPSNPGVYFYRLIGLGKRSEKWINLFGAGIGDSAPSDEFGVKPLDALIKDLETSVVDQYNRGGVTAKAKNAIDSALDAIAELNSKQRNSPDSEDKSTKHHE